MTKDLFRQHRVLICKSLDFENEQERLEDEEEGEEFHYDSDSEEDESHDDDDEWHHTGLWRSWEATSRLTLRNRVVILALLRL